MRTGELCAMMGGLIWRPMLSVGNWDIHDTVSFQPIDNTSAVMYTT